MRRKTQSDGSERPQDDRFETIATKISREEKKKLDLLLAAKGMNYYQWFQLMAEVTLRLCDERNAMTAEMAKLIQFFEMIPNWRQPTSFLDPNEETEIESAVYLLHTRGRSGLKPVMVEKGWMDGMWSETENVMDIVERVLEAALPKTYHWLRDVADGMGCLRVFDLIIQMADDAKRGTLQEEIAQLFADSRRSDYGRTVVYGEPRTKGLHHRTPDSLANSAQPSIPFPEAGGGAEEEEPAP